MADSSFEEKCISFIYHLQNGDDDIRGLFKPGEGHYFDAPILVDGRLVKDWCFWCNGITYHPGLNKLKYNRLSITSELLLDQNLEELNKYLFICEEYKENRDNIFKEIRASINKEKQVLYPLIHITYIEILADALILSFMIEFVHNKEDMLHRYTVIDYSKTAHCCFGFSVIDNLSQGYPVCETYDEEDARLICDLLNKNFFNQL